MKIRSGFVSNSSSASFIITAKCSLAEFGKIVDISKFSINPSDEIYSDKYVIKEDTLGNTNIYGWTCMFNDDDDFGPGFKEIPEILFNNNIVCKVEVHDEN